MITESDSVATKENIKALEAGRVFVFNSYLMKLKDDCLQINHDHLENCKSRNRCRRCDSHSVRIAGSGGCLQRALLYDINLRHNNDAWNFSHIHIGY